MIPSRIPHASVMLILLLASACAASPALPSPTPVPQATETHPPETPTPEASLIQIGYFSSIYLRYDPNEWEAMDEIQQQNNEGEPIQSLRHRTIPGCFLHENLGRGVPTTWQLEETDRVIGSLEFHVETWTDTTVQQPTLVVYQYPAGVPDSGKRIELVIDAEPEECIRSAEEVLILSSDLISANR